MNPNPTFEVARFKNLANPNGVRQQLDWPQLCELLTACDVRPGKDGELISAAIYREGPIKRANENVVALSGLMADCDESFTLEELRARVAETGACAIIYSSHRHGTPDPKEHPDAHAPGERYRAFFPLEEPVPVADYPQVWERFNWLFEGEIDPACKDPSRGFYLPSHPTGENFVGEVFNGFLLSIHDLPELAEEYQHPIYTPSSGEGTGGGRPGDDFNQRATNEDIAQILEAHGWRVTRSQSNRWKAKRPGKSDPGISATIGHYGQGVLHVFSSNADPFQCNHAYKPFGVLALLEYGGSFANAARELGKRGYGEQRQNQSQSAPRGAQEVPTKPPDEEDWAEPLPLKNALLPVPQLREELIPQPLRDWVFDCAERISVAPEYICVAALVGLASLVGDFAIRPKRRDDWRVVPNLWGGLMGSPSVKKTPAISEALKGLAHLKALALEKHKAEMKLWEADSMLNDLDAESLQKEVRARNKAGATRDELKEFIAQAQAEESAKPTLKTYSVQDSTIEALTNVLARNPRGFLIERDELTGWLRSLDKQGHEQDRAFYLEAWTGTAKNQQIERIGRGTVIVPHFKLTIIGTIQPLPFTQLVRSSSSAAGADGFVSRFQLLVYPDPPVEYKHVDRWPDKKAKGRAHDIFMALDNMTPESVGLESDDDNETFFFRFADAAQEVFDEWLIDLENRLLTMGGGLMEQHLAKYRSLMPSLALLFHLIDLADGEPNEGAVSLNAAMRATEWCEFLECHARRIYGMAGDGATDGAELIADRFGQLPNPFTVREVHIKRWAGLSDIDAVDGAVARLVDRGWLAPQLDAPPTGRPTMRYWKHPAKTSEK